MNTTTIDAPGHPYGFSTEAMRRSARRQFGFSVAIIVGFGAACVFVSLV